MDKQNLLAKYNYDSFVPKNFEPWMRFDQSPSPGSIGLDFTLWDLEEKETFLSQVWSAHQFTIIEFGSFT